MNLLAGMINVRRDKYLGICVPYLEGRSHNLLPFIPAKPRQAVQGLHSLVLSLELEVISCCLHTKEELCMYPVIAGLALLEILLDGQTSSLTHCIHHQWPHHRLEPTLQGIPSGLLQEQGGNNRGLLSHDPLHWVPVLLHGWQRCVGILA